MHHFYKTAHLLQKKDTYCSSLRLGMTVYCLLCYDFYHVSGQWTIHSQNSMEFPRLNQYQAEDKVSCSRTQCGASVETGTHDPYIYFIFFLQ